MHWATALDLNRKTKEWWWWWWRRGSGSGWDKRGGSMFDKCASEPEADEVGRVDEDRVSSRPSSNSRGLLRKRRHRPEKWWEMLGLRHTSKQRIVLRLF